MSNTTILPHLLKAREELLDLTARNRLLNTPKRAAQWGLKVVDTAAEEVFANLVERGKRLKFTPLLNAGEEESEEIAEAEDVELPEAEAGFTFAAISEDLPVKLDPEKLEKKLLKLQYDARTFEEEQGVNILYLAIGTLKWFEADHSDRPRFAPLIMVPVELDRNNIRSKFGLSWTEEEIATNLTLKVKLKTEFGLTLPEIEENEDLDVRDYLNRVQQMIADKPEWEVRSDDVLLWFFSFSKFLMYRDLHPENWPEGKGLEEHDLIESMFSDGFRNEPPICGDHDPIDDIIPPMDMVHVMDADSSQSVVVEEVKRGRNLVVQGPPGTGKSQTITNIIASAVTIGKKVLFVSEKMAALEVVKSRFEKVGLGELCLELHSHKTNKKVVLEDLSKTLNLGAPKHANFQQQAEELKTVRDRLNRHAKLLHQKLEPAGLSAFELIGHLTRMHSQGVPPSELVGPDAADWSASQFQEIHHQLEDMVLHLRKIVTPSEHIWRGVHLENPPLPTDLQRFESRFNEVTESLNPLIDAIEVLRNALSIDKAPSFSNSEKMRRAAQHLTNAPQMDLRAITNVIWEDRQEEITKVVNLGQSASQLEKELESRFAEVAWDTDVTSLRREIAAHGRSWFRIFKSGYRQAMVDFRGIVVESLPATHDERLESLDKLIKAQKQSKQLKEDQRIQKAGESAFGDNWRGIDSDWDLLSSILKWVANGQEIKSGMNLRLLLSDLQQQELEGDILRQINTHLKPVYLQVDELLKSFKLNLDEAFGVDDLRKVPLHVLQSRINSWRDNPEELSKWVQYDIRLNRLRNEGLTEVAEAIASGTTDAEDLIDRFEISYYEVLMRSAQKQFPELAQFDGTAHENLLSRFKDLDQERIRLARLEVATAHHDQLPQNSGDLGEVGVIRKEMAKKRKHLPIRRLLREAGRAIQSIKPVFMMSPISVAQFLEPGILDFDLLVIDEASQVKPVDALGAIARCHQIVVVGDDKQLPPTGFFDKVLAGDDEGDEESFSASDVKSILDLCFAQSVPTRMLEWHYRSRHHSLITVSNREFYDNRLYIVPHPSISGTEGLIFRHIRNGVYDRGGSRTNIIEAQEVAKAVMQHAANTPRHSLGVGTFSVAQRDAVLAEIERLRKEDPTHEEFFTTGVNEPFFVKNLENIQGDERDVIFISVGYGKDSSNKMTMNFGPLSSEGGERRLNVLITRAKERCEVFSSITADDIDLSKTTYIGTKSFKVFLNFAERGQMDVDIATGRDFDSEFEEEVARVLEDLGYEVHAQVGVAGFRVDLAVVDPAKPGRYLLGIECDGAAYHSSRSARDRDRIRQAVLEARNWIIHRIWSTDWFRRPQEQVTKTVESIEKAKLVWAKRGEPASGRPKAVPSDTVPQQIERSDSNPDDRNGDYSQMTTAYEEACFVIDSVIDWDGEDIHEIDPNKLSKVLHRVVEVEGPIHREEVTRRIATLWGLKRTGKRIVDAVSDAERVSVRQGLVDLRGNFLDIPSRDQPPIRNRESVNSSNLRKPEFLPPSEIQAAVVELVRSHYGIMKDEALTATARLFGFRTTSQQLREVIEESIEILISKNALQEIESKLTIRH